MVREGEGEGEGGSHLSCLCHFLLVVLYVRPQNDPDAKEGGEEGKKTRLHIMSEMIKRRGRERAFFSCIALLSFPITKNFCVFVSKGRKRLLHDDDDDDAVDS